MRIQAPYTVKQILTWSSLAGVAVSEPVQGKICPIQCIITDNIHTNKQIPKQKTSNNAFSFLFMDLNCDSQRSNYLII